MLGVGINNVLGDNLKRCHKMLIAREPLLF